MNQAKKQYKFYLSYWESSKLLKSDKEKVEFFEIINKIHFFEEHIDKITIKSDNVKLLFVSIKHSLNASIQGFCDKKEIDYDSLFNTPLITPLITPLATINKEQLTTNNKQLVIDNKKEKNNFDDFWKEYPKKRAGSKQKALKAYLQVLKEKRCSETNLLFSVKMYAKSEEVERGYAKGCQAWLNDDRFNNDYSRKENKTTNMMFDKYAKALEEEEDVKIAIN